jgi:hypothetical protein
MQALSKSAVDSFQGSLTSTQEETLRFTAAPSGITATLTFPDATEAALEQVSIGDVVTVGSANFFISSVTPAALQVGLESSLTIPTSTEVTIRREYPVFSSKSTGTDSAVWASTTGGADVPDVVGLEAGVVSRGRTEDLELGITLEEQVRPQVKVGDLVVLPAGEYKITKTKETSVSVSPTPDNDLSESGSVYALGAVRFETLLQAVKDWLGALNDKAYYDLQESFLPELLQALDSGDLEKADTLLRGYGAAVTELQQSLEALNWDALVVVPIKQLLEYLRDRGLDRGEELLRYGKLREFFASSLTGLSYKAQGMSSMSAANSQFVRDAVDDGDLNETPRYSADPERDFSDTDVTGIAAPGFGGGAY